VSGTKSSKIQQRNTLLVIQKIREEEDGAKENTKLTEAKLKSI
jgi:hypothetical protein